MERNMCWQILFFSSELYLSEEGLPETTLDYLVVPVVSLQEVESLSMSKPNGQHSLLVPLHWLSWFMNDFAKDLDAFKVTILAPEHYDLSSFKDWGEHDWIWSFTTIDSHNPWFWFNLVHIMGLEMIHPRPWTAKV